ncbi:hypothetical protein [Schaalia vaccimaxillae]|uniref:hypothetical protein n=1 Tax=Schaalia vaccimaxillae TaxID=183916 RepID=UPI0003B49ED8|nr:hypothetical protein [Schaalia vaccimaxillae]
MPESSDPSKPAKTSNFFRWTLVLTALAFIIGIVLAVRFAMNLPPDAHRRIQHRTPFVIALAPPALVFVTGAVLYSHRPVPYDPELDDEDEDELA